jgi:amino acid transporter
VGTITDLGAVVTFFSCFLGCITAAARVLFLMSRHGALHSAFGEAHEENQTPHRAVLWSSIGAFVPAAVLMLRGMTLFDIYGLLGALATFGFLSAYILVSVAAPLYLRSRDRLTVGAITVSILAILAMCVALFGNLYPVPKAPYSYLPYLYVVLLAAGFGWSVMWHGRPLARAREVAADLGAVPNETE